MIKQNQNNLKISSICFVMKTLIRIGRNQILEQIPTKKQTNKQNKHFQFVNCLLLTFLVWLCIVKQIRYISKDEISSISPALLPSQKQKNTRKSQNQIENLFKIVSMKTRIHNWSSSRTNKQTNKRTNKQTLWISQSSYFYHYFFFIFLFSFLLLNRYDTFQRISSHQHFPIIPIPKQKQGKCQQQIENLANCQHENKYSQLWTTTNRQTYK
jgi:hypothetical protein